MGNMAGTYGQPTSPYGSPGYYNPGQGQFPPQGYPPQGYPPQGYPPQGYPPQGYPPQGHFPGYPQGQTYPGPGYPQPGVHGPYYRSGPSAVGTGQAACCGSLLACLTCLFCSCSPCLMGGGGAGMRSEDNPGDNENEQPNEGTQHET